jgi:DNA-binding beta-propeller fold protein YncE
LAAQSADRRTTIDPTAALSPIVGKGRLGLAILACVGGAIAISTPSAAWKRGAVQTFALTGDRMVEGLAVGPDGKVYSPTFHLSSGMPVPGENSKLFTFDPQGHLLKQVTIAGSSSAMLGLEVVPGTTNALLVIDFGAGQVLSVDPNNGSTAAPCVTLPAANAPKSGLNGITFDTKSPPNIYVSDSFEGIIWRFSPSESGTACGVASVWASDSINGTLGGSLLPNNGQAPEGVPAFGANGIEFNKAGNAMFVCNTAMGWIVKIPVEADGTAGQPIEVFTNSINGCDGLRLDSDDNIWAAANQADEIVVVDPTGKAIAKLGDFDGLNGGVTNGLLFPASPAFSPDGLWLYVTNLELDLRTLGPNNTGPQAVDSQWAAEVTQHSIARLKAKIPPIQSSQ